MRLTPTQRAALLARLAAVLREEPSSDGHHELTTREDIDPGKARQFVIEETQRLDRRVWVLRSK
jgi:hypothetical protein